MKDVNITNVLQKKFHHDAFRVGQKEIILDILNGQDVLGILPTGAGKSLCYQLPALLFDGITVVISPLISLMIDQVRETKAYYFKEVAALHSMQSWQERQSILQSLSSYQLLYISPELIQQAKIIHLLQERKVSLFVIDEAHCISQWGHDFRQDYLRLNEVLVQFGSPTVLALTGTATETVQADIWQQLGRRNWKQHVYPIQRENIALVVEQIGPETASKLKSLEDVVNQFYVPTIIYFSSRKKAEEVAAYLQAVVTDHTVAFYHGGMEASERLRVQQQFLHDQITLICSTSAFGMGINKKNIRLIIHYHPPAEIESFIQEIGRAGRDGVQSVSLLLYEPGDIQVPFQLIEHESLTQDDIQFILPVLEKYARQAWQLPKKEAQIEEIFKINEIKWKFLYYQLESRDMIQHNKVIGNRNELIAALDDIWQFILARQRVKRGKVFEMLDYIQSETCLHEQLYASFKTAPHQVGENCCMHCHFSMQDWQVRQIEKETSQIYDWKQLLAQKLLIGAHMD